MTGFFLSCSGIVYSLVIKSQSHQIGENELFTTKKKKKMYHRFVRNACRFNVRFITIYRLSFATFSTYYLRIVSYLVKRYEMQIYFRSTEKFATHNNVPTISHSSTFSSHCSSPSRLHNILKRLPELLTKMKPRRIIFIHHRSQEQCVTKKKKNWNLTFRIKSISRYCVANFIAVLFAFTDSRVTPGLSPLSHTVRTEYVRHFNTNTSGLHRRYVLHIINNWFDFFFLIRRRIDAIVFFFLLVTNFYFQTQIIW